MERSISRGSLAAAAGLAMLSLGCNAFDRFEEGGATVFVFATHHATPENGQFPNRGLEDMPRVFENDLGWTVTMLEAYVTISAVTLVGCNGSEHDLNMFWGPCPEDLKTEDVATLTVAGNRVGDGNYCSLRVTYAAYETPVIDDDADETRHETPTNEDVNGTTVYIRGAAEQGDGEFIQFVVATPQTVEVELDLSNAEGPGRALNIAHREDFPKELLVSKAYDRFFDGIDFAALDANGDLELDPSERASIEANLGPALADNTRVTVGTVPEIY